MAPNEPSARHGDEPRYDDLGEDEQIAVRRSWAAEMAERRDRLDLRALFESEGWPSATLGTDGNVVIHEGDALETTGDDAPEF
jgi:hypothetical protein